jgi:hypothetical protein
LIDWHLSGEPDPRLFRDRIFGAAPDCVAEALQALRGLAVGPRSKGYVRKALRDRQQHLLLCLTMSWMLSFHNRSSTEFYVKRLTPVIVDDRAFRQKAKLEGARPGPS